jgi:hypothetical protein
MPRRSMMIIVMSAMLVGLLLGSDRGWLRHTVVREPQLIPPTAGEPAPFADPMVIAEIAPTNIATPMRIRPLILSSMALADALRDIAPRTRRFWGNRGYTHQDMRSTHIPDQERAALKWVYDNESY